MQHFIEAYFLHIHFMFEHVIDCDFIYGSFNINNSNRFKIGEIIFIIPSFSWFSWISIKRC